jgi:DNA mismatch repair protein MutL
MSTPVIQQLSPLTIQKIAAGEVIERPANVVKELVENALDAGATKISVTLEDGGKELIRVADNGSGMTREDLARCWLPHTTSKIRAVEDLEMVSSFGFRGEALASMASVSEFTVETRHWEEEIGSRLRVVESHQEELVDFARSQGTTITIRNLFRNNPVRRKFLASGKSEGTRISSMLTRLSLAHPGVSFRLHEGSRELLHLPEGTLRRRAGDVLGVHLLEDLVEVDWEGGGIHIQGYISEPQRFSGRPNQQHFFVNRRHVQGGMLLRAVAQAYEVAPPGRHPVAALFISISPAEVDVNVHPTKREVRFLNEARVFWSLSQALRGALRSNIAAPELHLDAPPAASISGNSMEATGFSFTPQTELVSPSPLDSTPVVEKTSLLFPTDSRPMAAPQVLETTGALCLQIHDSFILMAVRSGYLLVNQQAAHERILYEKAMDDLRAGTGGGRFSAQQLLFPELVELSPSEARLVEERLNELRALGFDLEPFGSTAFQLRGLPGEVAPEKARDILQSLIARLLDPERGEGKDGNELFSRVARAYARAAAIPLGQPLDSTRMAAIIDGLFATQNPYVTPSGAPVLIRYSLDELKRRFGIKAEEET